MAGNNNSNRQLAQVMGRNQTPKVELDRTADPQIKKDGKNNLTQELLEGAGILPHQLSEQPSLTPEQISNTEQDNTSKNQQEIAKALSEGTPLYERAEQKRVQGLEVTRAEIEKIQTAINQENQQSGVKNNEIDQTTSTQLADVGLGSYLKNFYAGLQTRLQSLKKVLQSLPEVVGKVRDGFPSSFNKVARGKRAKMRGHERTASVQDQITNHEKNVSTVGA
jgi:hypothetical protein